MSRFAQARKNNNDLLADCERLLLSEAAVPNDRRDDVIHPSEMAKDDWCPRSTFLRIKLSRSGIWVPGEAHRFQLENIFEEGHEYHRKWQDRFRRMGRLWGTWRCTFCREEWFDVSPERCPVCGNHGSGVHYREVPLNDPDALIYGRADGDVLAGGVTDERVLIEIKSIGEGTVRMELPSVFSAHTHKIRDKWGKDQPVLDTRGVFREIHMPFPPHLRQGRIYLRMRALLADRINIPEVERIAFIYEFKPTSMVKAFYVTRDDRSIDHLWDLAEDIVYALETPTAATPRCGSRDGECEQCAPYVKAQKEQHHDSGSGTTPGAVVQDDGSGGPTREAGDPALQPATERAPRSPRGHDRADRRVAARDDASVPGVGGLLGGSARHR